VNGEEGKTVIFVRKEDNLLVKETFCGGTGAGKAKLTAKVESVEGEEVKHKTGAFWLGAGKRVEETCGARTWVVGDFD